MTLESLTTEERARIADEVIAERHLENCKVALQRMRDKGIDERVRFRLVPIQSLDRADLETLVAHLAERLSKEQLGVPLITSLLLERDDDFDPKTVRP